MRHIRLQWVTIGVIALNVIVFVVFNLLGTGADGGENFAAIALGHVPSVANEIRALPVNYQLVPPNLYLLTTITSAFLHADIWHLGGNMLFIWVFGDNVEDAMGHVKYLLFYLFCAFAAAWFHAFAFPQSDAPLIGASGAAAGIIAAYLMLHPKMKVWVLFMGRIPLRLPALYLLGGWIAYQIGMFLLSEDTDISWAAHVGGIMTGIVLVGLLKRPEVPLFDRQIIIPDAVDISTNPQTPADPSPHAQKWGR